MISITTKRWTMTTAKTDVALETCSATQRAIIYGAVATCSNANTGDVSLDVGCAAATLPALGNDSATGAVGVPITHPGIAKGGGFVWSMGGQPLVVGAAGEDILITCSAATGGALRLVLLFRIEDMTEAA